ncbi:hypothetical protein AVEN_271622-1 [Araneus ventricosus]|uniref:Uncharacterized protein n=1 Tax=Araneus ventricosus TaxID=182803 RepID=A0A4Y2RYP3_ARAVE|nr:hypothetical protein AVEN_271622-1 [Araneus ventricosus]
MSSKGNERSKSKSNNEDILRRHDIYKPGVTFHRPVTRSQTPFNRIKKSMSDLDLFSDSSAYHPPGLPHLMETLKGPYGAIPRTIITRSGASKLEINKELCKQVDKYKMHHN